MVRKQVCFQRPHNLGLGISNLESHWFGERLSLLEGSLTGDAAWRRKVLSFSQPEIPLQSRCRRSGDDECRKALLQDF